MWWFSAVRADLVINRRQRINPLVIPATLRRRLAVIILEILGILGIVVVHGSASSASNLSVYPAGGAQTQTVEEDPNAQHLAIVQGELSGKAREIVVMVEAGALRLESILEAGPGVRMSIINPADRPLVLDEPNVAVTATDQRRSILVWDPRPGVWRIRLEGQGRYRFRAISQGELFVCCGQILTLNQIFALERSRFVAGSAHQVQIFASGYSIDSIDIKLVDQDGEVIGPVRFRQNDPSNLSSYVLLLEVPTQPFRIMVEGRDLSDRPFRRILPPLITPLRDSDQRREAEPLLTDIPQPNPRAIEELRQTATAGLRQVTRTSILSWSDEPYLSARGNPIGIRVRFRATFPADANYTPFPTLYPDRIGQGYTGALNLQIHQATVSPQPIEMSQPAWSHITRGRFQAGIEYQFVIDLVPSYAFAQGGEKGFCLNYRPYSNQPGLLERFEREISSRQRARFRFNVSGSNFEGRMVAVTEKTYLPVDWLNGLKREGAALCTF